MRPVKAPGQSYAVIWHPDDGPLGTFSIELAGFAPGEVLISGLSHSDLAEIVTGASNADFRAATLTLDDPAGRCGYGVPDAG